MSTFEANNSLYRHLNEHLPTLDIPPYNLIREVEDHNLIRFSPLHDMSICVDIGFTHQENEDYDPYINYPETFASTQGVLLSPVIPKVVIPFENNDLTLRRGATSDIVQRIQKALSDSVTFAVTIETSVSLWFSKQEHPIYPLNKDSELLERVFYEFEKLGAQIYTVEDPKANPLWDSFFPHSYPCQGWVAYWPSGLEVYLKKEEESFALSYKFNIPHPSGKIDTSENFPTDWPAGGDLVMAKKCLRQLHPTVSYKNKPPFYTKTTATTTRSRAFTMR